MRNCPEPQGVNDNSTKIKLNNFNFFYMYNFWTKIWFSNSMAALTLYNNIRKRVPWKVRVRPPSTFPDSHDVLNSHLTFYSVLCPAKTLKIVNTYLWTTNQVPNPLKQQSINRYLSVCTTLELSSRICWMSVLILLLLLLLPSLFFVCSLICG